MLRPEVSALLQPRGRHNAFGRGPDVRNGPVNSRELQLKVRDFGHVHIIQKTPQLVQNQSHKYTSAIHINRSPMPDFWSHSTSGRSPSIGER